MIRLSRWLLCSLLLIVVTACLPPDSAVLSTNTPPVFIETAPTRADTSTTRTATRTPKATPIAARRVKNQPGDFDFYVLSLSWSPDYCALNGDTDPQQCSLGKKLGFVLHGLWPQYTTGYPSDCATATLPAQIKTRFATLFPNASLMIHEWNTHGTCSGLTPVEYLMLAQDIKASVTIPIAYQRPAKAFRATTDALKQAFVEANPNFAADVLTINCSGAGRFLQEIHICFSRQGEPIACSRELQKDEARSCQHADFLVRNVK